MSFCVLSRHIGVGWKKFCAEVMLFSKSTGLLVREVAQRLWGEIQSPGTEWRRSKFRGVVQPLVGTGATECDESKFSSRLLQRCRMVDSSSTSSSPSPTVKTAALLKGTKQPKPARFFLCPSLSPARTFSFFHSLTHFVFSLPPPSSVGVSCFALLLPHGAAHADPRREGGGEELNAHLLPKIVYVFGRLLLLSVQQWVS